MSAEWQRRVAFYTGGGLLISLFDLLRRRDNIDPS
jgi:hypothetical protein